jgi:arabinogalactan endo-1,4-beta-galactosidase
MTWNRFRFQETIFEDCEEFSVTLENRNDEMNPVIVSDDIKILPVQGTPNPEFNSKIEMLHGPFWEFTDTVAISSYEVWSMPVDAVKNQLKAVLAAERYRKEIAGVKVTIQNTEVTVDTTRDIRNNLVHHYVLMEDNDTIQWKFNTTWLTLTKSEVETLVKAGKSYIQTQFEWEANLIIEINNATTLEQLDSIVIVEPLPNLGI